MTSYHGGKQKIGEKIASVINEYVSEDVRGYCEPFCGMLGVYRHIPYYFGDIIYKAGDYNTSLIMMWKKAQKGWIPPESCTKEEYLELKNEEKSSPERGFIGTVCSYGSIFFGGSYRLVNNGCNTLENSKKIILNNMMRLFSVDQQD